MRNLGNFARDKGVYQPIEINNWIVMLKEDDENLSESVKPTQLYQAGLERTTKFQKQLESWIADKGLLLEVAEIGKPTSFPLVTIACTPAVAKMIESLPEVDAVMVDGPYLSLIA